MKYKKQIFAVAILMVLSVQTAYAQFSILPKTDLKEKECTEILNKFEVDGVIPSVDKTTAESAHNEASKSYEEAASKVFDEAGSPKECEAGGLHEGSQVCQDYLAAEKAYDETQTAVNETADLKPEPNDRDRLLGCAITSGRISLRMIPFFVTYIANFLLAMSGLIATLFVVVGGYYYIYGGLTDQKEKGKKTIINALWGISLASLSWVLINIILAALTS